MKSLERVTRGGEDEVKGAGEGVDTWIASGADADSTVPTDGRGKLYRSLSDLCSELADSTGFRSIGIKATGVFSEGLALILNAALVGRGAEGRSRM